MAEYIELNELQKFCRKYTEVHVVGMILANRTDLLHTADVIDRSEYEKLKKENAELKINYDDTEKRFCHAMDEKAKLRSKIDKAIEDIPSLSHWQSSDGQDLVMVADIIELIKRNIGE